ncbi:MAG: ABC transporter ATP-binding protein [Chloroflexi bacterium]|nr:ABC transporter ATP-binding protein [Chloroflexota bacterium]
MTSRFEPKVYPSAIASAGDTGTTRWETRLEIGDWRLGIACSEFAIQPPISNFQFPTSNFWALKDVSVEVERGKVLGVIGRNGAGKSTLLKILSRVTRPTAGRAMIHGRVGSLLEVGTGFHPELTGRENIYLNGAVLGMTRAEINQKFDEIVAFAEIEQFLDTPVKRYSSGMYMRLAFSIAAHLEPEIPIVDEVLAVGDVAFRQKCLGKMQDVSSRAGRTVLFVSHDMDAIRRLCPRCLLLEHGHAVADGDTASVVARYLAFQAIKGYPNEWQDLSRAAHMGTGEARFSAYRFASQCAAVGFQPYSKGPLEFDLAIETDAARTVGSIAVDLSDASGLRLVNANTVLINRAVALRKGRNVVRLRIANLYLNPGTYRLGLWLADPVTNHATDTAYDHIESAGEIEVVRGESEENTLNPNSVVTCDFDVVAVS